LLLAGGGDGHDALDEAGAVSTLSAETALAPENGWAERTLGGVVGRLDASDVSEGPEGGPGIEQVDAEGTGDDGMRRLEPVVEGLVELLLEWRQLEQEGRPIDRLRPEPVPDRKDPGRDGEQSGAERLLVLVVGGDLAELADQVRPAQLPLLEGQVPLRRVAVRAHDTGPVEAQQRLHDGLAPSRV
jgi:hypothetical protein